MGRRRSSAVNDVFGWIRKQSMKVKIFLAATSLLLSLVALKLLVKDYNHFFIASELIHVAGIVVLVYKLTTKKTCSGIFISLFFLFHIYTIHITIFNLLRNFGDDFLFQWDGFFNFVVCFLDLIPEKCMSVTIILFNINALIKKVI